MKTRLIISSLFIITILAACRSAKPSPSVTAEIDNEFILAPNQSVAITSTDLTINFNSVLSDDRCPSEVECVASGPVTVSLSIQQDNNSPIDFILQTFTDQNGRSPNVQFEGVTNRAEVGDYLIRIAGVTPYPEDPTVKLEPSEYRLVLVVSKK
jgi:hypothetical protein